MLGSLTSLLFPQDSEKELGERNFGFDSLKSRLKRDMEEKGIVSRDCLPPKPHCPLSAAEAPPPRCSSATTGLHCILYIVGDNPGQQVLHVTVQSVLQIDVKVEDPETLWNPTQSFEIHYLPEVHTAFGRDNIQYIDVYII